ncbi:type II toxin-antitoxin system VapC family toxin [Methylobacterium sp. NEAU 140]|uniref:type II toxin-antitoxin system VapC family toxin n=1 Tax=Methylobacterium sp. NEAU 140 TaxID=3064945 RepID=UPI00273464CC|nr:type II toxin-antitoxin system VapC family toxin [Methylobacterium sp. NEAU 140]MDP4023923.1 type II toxin-antitoxin system VapC family toxin [Methylobacterium sp. NEAU 140]
MSTVVIDTSVYIAILAQEPDAPTLSVAIRTFRTRLMAAASYLECAIVSARWQAGRAELDAWLGRESIEIAPVDHALARIAADAFARYGKGRHPAGLNFGDCFAYALARTLNAPLLFKGHDFARTDIASARP